MRKIETVIVILLIIGIVSSCLETRAERKRYKELEEQNKVLWQIYVECRNTVKELIKINTKKDGGSQDEVQEETSSD